MTDQNGMVEQQQYEMVNTNQASNSLAAIEGNRAVAEVQASLVLARANPRNEAIAERSIMNSCKRVSLAKSATYLFRRGGTNVTGPTIRLAEVMARAWGNMNYGFRELDRGEDYSEIETFAYDLQSNVKVIRQFRVKHWRDKKGGGEALTQERDKYEFIASQAQRRVRACILEILPGDIVEMAVEACDATVNGSIGDLPKAIEGIVSAFLSLDVTKEDIEGYLQRKMSSLVPADIVNLRKIHTSIKNGIAPKEEFFREDDISNLNKRFAGKKAPAKTKDSKKATPKEEKKSEPALVNRLSPDHPDNQEPPISSEPGDTTPDPEGVSEPTGQIACPEAGGMMVDAANCKGQACYPGCPEWGN